MKSDWRSVMMIAAAVSLVAFAGRPFPAAGEETKAPVQLVGPKRTVAVGKFDAIGAFTRKHGNWDIGGGLAAMLTSALIDSGRFVVIERAELKEVLGEQELKASKLTDAETGPKLGKLAGVQYLIFGAVTEFGEQDKGGGLNIGAIAGGSLPFKLGGALESASGRVAMDVRVVDTTTGEVVESHVVAKEIESSAFNLSAGYSGMSFGGDTFNKTPLGEATRSAVKDAVDAITRTAAAHPWLGLVVEIDGNEIYINAGRNAGVSAGDMFMIERITKTFTDPSTGQVLGARRRELGVLKISEVEEKLSIGVYSPISATAPKRGDRVVTITK
jgi:curli biogenesis system outer membrane secretion channel CsgG